MGKFFIACQIIVTGNKLPLVSCFLVLSVKTFKKEMKLMGISTFGFIIGTPVLDFW